MRVSTPLVPEMWEYFLQDYPDRKFVAALAQIMRQGAHIGFSGPVAARPAKNLMFALENPQFMDNSIAALLSNQQIHGPFCASPLPEFCTSPLGR